MRKKSLQSETCQHNLWPAQLLNEAIHATAMDEAALANDCLINDPQVYAVRCQYIRERWLEAMMPAGNA